MKVLNEGNLSTMQKQFGMFSVIEFEKTSGLVELISL